MSGAEQEPKNDVPEILPSQIAVKELSDEMLSHRDPDVHVNVIWFNVDLHVSEVERLLKDTSVSDLLLSEGDSLSADPPNPYWTDLKLYIGKAEPFASELIAWGWDLDAEQNPIRLGEDTEVKYWGRNLEIKVWYTNGDQTAGQEIGVQTWSYHGSTPHFHRNITAPAYAEMGYEGHNPKTRQAKSEDEVLEFVRLARSLFENSHRRGTR